VQSLARREAGSSTGQRREISSAAVQCRPRRSFCFLGRAELAACNALACAEPDRNRRIRAQLWISVHRGCVKGLLLLLACEDKHRFEA